MPERKLLSPLFAYRIENIVSVLGRSINSLTIRNWLENFSESEWDLALRVIERIKYFSLNDIIQEYNESLTQILKAVPENKTIFILASSGYGKSGPAMIYFLKSTKAYMQYSSRFQILSHGKKLKAQGVRDKDTVILVDDFIGTGGSSLRYYNEYIVKQIAHDGLQMRIGLVCVAYLTEAQKLLSQKIKYVKIFGSPYLKVFSSRGSPFGYRPKMLPIRDFCYQYAIQEKLFETIDYQSQSVKSHPLGYENSQALIIFEHTVPNNTLPIIWSTKNKWVPLYPRGGAEKMNRAKQFREESRYWISMARKLGFIKADGESTKSIYSNVDYRIFSVLRLIKAKTHPFKICQVLGLSITEYNAIIENGAQKNFFEPNSNRLTSYGDKAYQEISSSLKSLIKKRSQYDSITENEIIDDYIPKKFLGKT